jgi:GH24 family phage-related lysozyme (muramidase)
MPQTVDDAFNSMLRADYIPLKDTAKLSLLAQYYVDYYGFLNQILSESDQLIVGCRGTGKTTLLYRALVRTIGYGHTGPGVHAGLTITQEQADTFPQSDFAGSVACVNKLVTANISQFQSDALVDLHI